MKTPNVYWITELTNAAMACQRSHPTLGWTPARPLGLYGLNLRKRLHLAWLVFTGKADVVRWFDEEVTWR